MNLSTPWSRAGLQPARARSGRRVPPALALPALAVALAVMLPLAYLVLRAVDAMPQGWELLFRPRTLSVLANSIALTATVTLSALLLALPLAWLTTATDLPGQRFWRIATVMPLVIPSYVGGFAVLAMLGPRGMLQGWLAPFGVERLPEIYGFPGAWLTLTLFTYPYALLTLRAAWQRLDPGMEEASHSLGHGPWQTFRRVTLPLLRPAMAAGGLLVALYTLSDFGAVSLLRYDVFTQAIYVQYRSSFDRSLAALLALLLVLITLAILWGEQRARGRGRYAQGAGSSGRRRQPVKLGRWRWPALIFTSLVVLLALGLPLAMILAWLGRGLAAGETLGPLWRPTLNSVYAASLAALVTALAALPVAILAVRYEGRFGLAVEKASYLGFGLPGIVIALSLVFFAANTVPFLYQTLALLILAYGIRFLPQALGSTRASLLQVSPRLEEAGRSLGLPAWRAWLQVTLPLIRPGILAGTALVFLTVIKELPATLLLRPTGFDTLATEVWSATTEAFFARAAAPALLLVLVSSLSIGLVLSRERDDVSRS